MTNITHIEQRKLELSHDIQLYRKSIRRLLDIATGYKTIRKSTELEKAFKKTSDTRLLATLKNLHVQARKLKYILNKLSIKTNNKKRKKS